MASLHEAYTCYSDNFNSSLKNVRSSYNQTGGGLTGGGLFGGICQSGGSVREGRGNPGRGKLPEHGPDYIKKLELPEHRNILNVDDDSPEMAQNFYVSPIQTNVIEDLDDMDDFDPVYLFEQRNKDVAFQIPYNTHLAQTPDDGETSLHLTRSGERHIETIKELHDDPNIKLARTKIKELEKRPVIRARDLPKDGSLRRQKMEQDKIMVQDLRAAAGLPSRAPPEFQHSEARARRQAVISGDATRQRGVSFEAVKDGPSSIASGHQRIDQRLETQRSDTGTSAPTSRSRIGRSFGQDRLTDRKALAEDDIDSASTENVLIESREVPQAARRSYSGLSTDPSESGVAEPKRDRRTVGQTPSRGRRRLTQRGRGRRQVGGADCSEDNCTSLINHILACTNCTNRFKKLLNVGKKDLQLLGIDLSNIDMSKMMFYIIVIILIIAVYEFLNSLFRKLNG